MSIDLARQEYTLVPLGDVREHPENPRIGNVQAIVTSIRRNGWHGALVVQRSSHYVLAGNHRLKAARQIGMTHIPVLWLDCDDRMARRVLIADNRASDLSVFDRDQLLALLDDVDADDLAGMLFSTADLADLAAGPEELVGPVVAEDEDDSDEMDAGSELALVDVTWGEPTHVCEVGQHWRLGHHHLFVTDPYRNWQAFVPTLEPPMVLCPFPEPYLTMTRMARERPMCLVQPKPYLAGHLLDKHASLFGNEELALVSGPVEP